MGHREQLLAAARQLLEEKGYARITTRDLVAASGTNLASIGYHFGSKAELLNEAIGVVLEEWTQQLAKIAMADPAASPIERGISTWTAMLEHARDRRTLALSFTEALAQAERSPRLRDQFADLYRRCRAQVSELVAAAIGDGISPQDPRCTSIASFVIAACDGLAMQCLIDPDQAPTAEAMRAGLTTLLMASLPGVES